MQTLIDPFELAAARVPQTKRPVPVAPSVEVDVDDDRPAPSRPIPPSPDSSGRLRQWCSED